MAKSHAHGASFRSLLRLFGLFGHPVRVVIFQRLSRTPMTAGELAQSLPISRTAVVQHLKQLEAARLVDASPDGRKRVYRIRPKGLVPLDQWVRQHLDESTPADHRAYSTRHG
jgi:DNA-binding transcriptional ArsR family regulator